MPLWHPHPQAPPPTPDLTAPSGPGGYLQYVLFDLTTRGFQSENFDVIVDGIVRSIVRAHNNVADGRMHFSSSTLFNSSINRSPSAYLNNPAEERARFDGNVDSTFAQVKFSTTDGVAVGLANWFAVHCTAMNNSNQLISGDNKGAASYMFEKHVNPDALPGTGPFVAAFFGTNLVRPHSPPHFPAFDQPRVMCLLT